MTALEVVNNKVLYIYVSFTYLQLDTHQRSSALRGSFHNLGFACINSAMAKDDGFKFGKRLGLTYKVL